MPLLGGRGHTGDGRGRFAEEQTPERAERWETQGGRGREEVLKGHGDVAPARATANRGLVWGQNGLDRGADNVHDGAAKEAAKTSGELERALPVDRVGKKFFGDPQEEVDVLP